MSEATRASGVELDQLRFLVAVVDTGTFTDAAIELGVSQAAVSRMIARLEQVVGVRVLRRTSREVALTATGARMLPHARQLLSDAHRLVEEARSGHDVVRIGYAWSSVGRHTVEFQRRWHSRHPEVLLQLVRVNASTAGLAEGQADLAILRNHVDTRRFESIVIGLERRYAAVASDDAWARRRSLRMAEFTGRTVAMDLRTGTTTPDLWRAEERPQALVETFDIDNWLDRIAASDLVGMTSEATVSQYPRPGIAYRVVRDAPPITVHLAWWRDDRHPATPAVIELLTELYRSGSDVVSTPAGEAVPH